MTEIAVRLYPGFTTADAEYPSFSFKDGTLDLEFLDWKEEPVSVRFCNAVAVNWRELDVAAPNPRLDETYEIRNSNWITSHYCQGAREPSENLRHFRLCFNACGTLDVISGDMNKV